MCCDSWGRRESDMTEQLNCTEGFNTGLPQWPSRVCLSVQEEQKAWVQSLGKDEHLGGRGGVAWWDNQLSSVKEARVLVLFPR